MENKNNTTYNLIKKIVKKHNIFFIDIYEGVFKKEKNPKELFPFGVFGHYNEKGYMKIAEYIYKITQ